MKQHKYIAGFLLLLLVHVCLTSASADTIDSIVLAEMKRQYSPGVAIAVVKNGRPVKVAGYGLANIEQQSKVTPTTFFQTGSVGKQFVAALALLLVNDDKVKLDAPLSEYLPNTPPAWHSMTIRQLLTNTSGMATVDEAIDSRRDYTEAELLESAYKLPPVSPPGERFSYSNPGLSGAWNYLLEGGWSVLRRCAHASPSSAFSDAVIQCGRSVLTHQAASKRPRARRRFLEASEESSSGTYCFPILLKAGAMLAAATFPRHPGRGKKNSAGILCLRSAGPQPP